MGKKLPLMSSIEERDGLCGETNLEEKKRKNSYFKDPTRIIKIFNPMEFKMLCVLLYA